MNEGVADNDIIEIDLDESNSSAEELDYQSDKSADWRALNEYEEAQYYRYPAKIGLLTMLCECEALITVFLTELTWVYHKINQRSKNTMTSIFCIFLIDLFILHI